MGLKNINCYLNLTTTVQQQQSGSWSLRKQKKIFSNKMCLCVANSNEGQDHKDKYFDTSRKILS